MKIFSNLHLVFLTILIPFIISCKKERSEQTINSENIKAPSNFAFTTEKQISYVFSLADNGISGKHRLNIYQTWTNKGGQGLMTSLLIENTGSYEGVLNFPAHLDRIFALVTTPNGSSYLEVISIKGSGLNHQLGVKTLPPFKKGTMASPDCNSGCDASFNSSFNIKNNTSGNTFCITGGNNLNVNVNKKNVTIRVCGNVSFQNISLSKGSVLEITDNAVVTFEHLNVPKDGEVIIYNANVTVNQNLISTGNTTNHGTLKVLGALNINSSGELINEVSGTIDVDGHFNNNEDLTNKGFIHVDGHLNFNGSSTTYNYCQIITEDKLHINNNLHNYGYIEAALEIHFNANNQGSKKTGTELYDGSMIKGLNGAHLTGYVHGNGITSLIQIAGVSNITGGGELSGNVEFCDQDGVEVMNGTINAPAALACNTTITPTACNPGTGLPPCVDTDGDGVCDDVDKFPNDPDLAGCVCYPSCDEFATLAYEDLWPFEGDYDFNDLVINYQYVHHTNADNKVVKTEPSFLIRAIGASFTNGFGFQLDIAPGDVSSVSGQKFTENLLSIAANGTENGQNKAIIMVFDNSYTAFSVIGGGKFTNTYPQKPYEQPDTIFMSVDYTTPLTLASLGTAPYNPFIFTKSKREREVHLINHLPTQLMNMDMLGTGDDASVPANNIYYIGQNGLPWAINIPVSFDYPIEMMDVADAYLHFAAWAQSGGAVYNDWYLNNPGYRDNSKIY